MGKEAQLRITERKRRWERQNKRNKERKDRDLISEETETKERTWKDIQERGKEDEEGQIAEERKTRVRQNIRKTVQWDWVILNQAGLSNPVNPISLETVQPDGQGRRCEWEEAEERGRQGGRGSMLLS